MACRIVMIPQFETTLYLTVFHRVHSTTVTGQTFSVRYVERFHFVNVLLLEYDRLASKTQTELAGCETVWMRYTKDVDGDVARAVSHVRVVPLRNYARYRALRHGVRRRLQQPCSRKMMKYCCNNDCFVM